MLSNFHCERSLGFTPTNLTVIRHLTTRTIEHPPDHHHHSRIETEPHTADNYYYKFLTQTLSLEYYTLSTNSVNK